MKRQIKLTVVVDVAGFERANWPTPLYRLAEAGDGVMFGPPESDPKNLIGTATMYCLGDYRFADIQAELIETE